MINTDDKDSMKEALKRRRGHALDLTIVMGSPHEKTAAGAIDQKDEHGKDDDGELAPDVKDEDDSNLDEDTTEKMANHEIEGHDMGASGELKGAHPSSDSPHEAMAKVLSEGPLGKSHLKHKGMMHKPMHKLHEER